MKEKNTIFFCSVIALKLINLYVIVITFFRTRIGKQLPGLMMDMLLTDLLNKKEIHTEECEAKMTIMM